LTDRALKVLETVAMNGLTSGYGLGKTLRISVSHAQWWLSNLREVKVYRRERVKKRRVLYGLTEIGLLVALESPRVRRNFAKVFETFLGYQDDKGITADLKNNLFESLKSTEISDRFKEFYLEVSDALRDLYYLDEVPDHILFDLATYFACLRKQKKMFGILVQLHPRVLLVQRIVEGYKQFASQLDKIMKEEIP